MSNDATTSLTTVTNLSKLCKIIFLFEANPVFPWLALTLQRHFQVSLEASTLVHPQLTDPTNLPTVYKTNKKEIKYFAANCSILEEILKYTLIDNSNNTQLCISKDVASDQRELLKLKHANNILSSIRIFIKKNTYLVAITSKDDAVYLTNNTIINWRAKTRTSNFLVHVAFPIVYP